MSPNHDDSILPDDLLARTLDRLGLDAAPAPDLDGLRAVYGAWSARVPFDNVRKLVTLRAGDGRPFPGGFARDFLENWLEHGTGGTCWPSSNALFALVRSLGFDARRVAGSMRDLGIVNHASVKVRLDGLDWLVDSSQLSGLPLPLRDEVHAHDDPVQPIEIEPVDGTHVMWALAPPNSTHMPCRLLLDPVDHAYYLEAYERSRQTSPFNQRLYARRHPVEELRVLVGHVLFVRTAGGLERRELGRDGLRTALRDDIGVSEAMIDSWARSGALDASFEEPPGPKPPPITGRPPSQRAPRVGGSS